MNPPAPLLRALLPVFALHLALPGSAHAALGSADFLKTDGKFIRKNSGTGAIVNLRGTNLGSWLPLEDWMSPLGEFAHDRTGWTATASVNSASAGSALDGNYTTRWNTGTNQAPGQWFQVNLGQPRLFSRVYVNAAEVTGEYPRGYQILVSPDGTTWKDVASGTSTTQNTIVRFTPQVAQYVRVVQTGTSGTNWWSITEFNVFNDAALHNAGVTATASSTGGGSSTGNAFDGNVDTRWTSGAAQAPGQWFEIDLGQYRDINGLLIDAGPTSTGDYPRGFEILGHDNGTWTKVASGQGTGRITRVELFATARVNRIRLVQTGTSTSWWSIAEVAFQGGNDLERTGWTVTASSTEAGGSVNNVKDGNHGTRWSTGLTQAPGQWLQVDFGAAITINQVVLDTAKNSGDEQDYPRGYTLSTSLDGTNWTQVASGAGGRKATPINFNAVNARYFRITLTATAAQWWSIGELTASLNNDHFSMATTYEQRFGRSVADSLYATHQDNWFLASDLDKLQAMGVNVIRLPIAWNTLLNLDGTWRTNPWTKIDWIIQEAGARDMYILLDLHTQPGGGAPWGSAGRIGPNPNAFWTTPTYQAWLIDIWEAIANRYKGNPVVAGYDLMNEPLIDYAEDGDDVIEKSLYYDDLYTAVRAIDPDHTIYIAAFFGWDKIATPGTFGWTNVVYEIHPYDMPGMRDWTRMHNLVDGQLADVAAKMEDPNWAVPVLYGEYCFSHYDDLWAKFMSGMNALNVSWTNWTYKVTRPMYLGGGGYWGLYNTNANPVPIINNDSSAGISAKLTKFTTANFVENTSFVNVLRRFSQNQQWMATVPLDQTGWVATASSTAGGDSPANALDWNPNTRWSTGVAQAPGQWFQVNLGSRKVFDQVSFETRSSDQWDFPRGFEVQVSTNGTTWTTLASGESWGWKQPVVFAPQFAQYVRVRQTGTAHEWWSIGEFHMYSVPALARTGWVATASSTESGSAAANAIDSSATTRWRSAANQASGMNFRVDLGQYQTFNRLSLDAGTSTSEYPRNFQVEVSLDGVAWTTVATGTGTTAATVIEFPVQRARHVKVTLTGSASNRWSIHDLQVYGELEKSRTGWTATASSTEYLGSPQNALDGNYTNRWSGGVAQAPGQWYKVDMGSNQWINHVIMDAGTNVTDFPRGFIVEVSYDNANWRIVANGEGTGPITTVNFPIIEARYVRVTLKGSSGSWWSISEFRVFE